MVQEPKTIHVDEHSDLARALDDAEKAPIRLVKNGVTYRVSREDAMIWAGYDVDRARDGMHAAAGAIEPEEARELKEYFRRAREQGTRPLDRPGNPHPGL